MIAAQPGRDVERDAAVRRLRGRQQDLLFDADVPQQPATELVVRPEIDRIAALGGVEQRIQAAVIFGQVLGDRRRSGPLA